MDAATALRHIGHQGLRGFQATCVVQGSHLHSGLQAVPDLDGASQFRKPRREAVGDAFVHEEPARRKADLSGIAKFERHAFGRDLVDIHIVEHDDRRMATKFHGGRL